MLSASCWKGSGSLALEGLGKLEALFLHPRIPELGDYAIQMPDFFDINIPVLGSDPV